MGADSGAWVIGLVLLETDSIHHDPTLDMSTDDVKRLEVISSMVDNQQGNKLAAAFDELLSDLRWLGMVLKRVS